jgi:single stranded DNA-binding protein
MIELKDGLTKVVFSLAVDRDYKNKETKERESDFFDYEVWGDRARLFAKSFNKGDAVLVHTTAKQDRWKDKETDENRAKVIYQVDRFEFLPLNPKGQISRTKAKDGNDEEQEGYDETENEQRPRSRATGKKNQTKSTNTKSNKPSRKPWEDEDEDGEE